MEREMRQYLEWELSMDPATLKEFGEMVRKDFAGIGSYPTHILPSTKSTPSPSAIPFHPICGISPSPLNKQRYTSPPKVPSPPYASPPETLSPSYSTSSPVSSASPPTTADIKDLSAKIVSASSLPGCPKPTKHVQPPAKQKQNVHIRIALRVVVHVVYSFASRLYSLLDEWSTYRIQCRHR